jgi:hypothetical protein
MTTHRKLIFTALRTDAVISMNRCLKDNDRFIKGLQLSLPRCAACEVRNERIVDVKCASHDGVSAADGDVLVALE